MLSIASHAPMKRRFATMALTLVVVPLGARAADTIADRLEAGHSPTTATKLLRRSSSLGRRLTRSSEVRSKTDSAAKPDAQT